jgi:hypothetical protein
MVTTIHPVDATSGAPAYGGRMLRQVGSVAYVGAAVGDPFGGRSGVRPGTSVTTVTATSTVWTVNPHAGLLDFEAAMESGPTPYAIDAAVTGAVTAAAGSARIDIVWVRQDIPLEDGASVPAVVPGYTAGTAGSGVPPTTPARCLVLATVNVPASGGGSPTVTWVAPYTVAAGGVLPVPAGVRPANPYLGQYIDDATSGLLRYDGAVWAGGSWTAYTATLSAWNVGTGTVSTVWRREGDLIRVRYAFVYGSGATVPTNPSFSLPVPSSALAAAYVIAGTGSLYRVSGNVVYPAYPTLTGSPAACEIHYGSPLVNLTATVPFAWAVGDAMTGEFTYRP